MCFVAHINAIAHNAVDFEEMSPKTFPWARASYSQKKSHICLEIHSIPASAQKLNNCGYVAPGLIQKLNWSLVSYQCIFQIVILRNSTRNTASLRDLDWLAHASSTSQMSRNNLHLVVFIYGTALNPMFNKQLWHLSQQYRMRQTEIDDMLVLWNEVVSWKLFAISAM